MIENTSKLRNVSAAVFSGLIVVGIVTCVICDLAVTGKLSWSLISISSLLYSWLLFFPGIFFKRNSICFMIVSLSVFTVPYLYVIRRVLSINETIINVGIPISLIAILYAWCCFVIFKLAKKKIKIACALCLLLAIPVSFAINYSLTKTLNEPLVDVWDVLTYALLAVGAVVLFILSFRSNKENA